MINQQAPVKVTLHTTDGYPRCPCCGNEDLHTLRRWLYEGYLMADQQNSLMPYQAEENPVEDRWEAVWCVGCGWEVQDRVHGLEIEIVSDDQEDE